MKMTLKAQLVTYAKYNYWANDALISWLKSNNQDTLQRITASSFGAITDTLNHIVSAQKFYVSMLNENPARFNHDRTLEDIYLELLLSSNDLIVCITSLSDEEIAAYRNLDVGPVQGSFPLAGILMHCINHSTYHRGQVVTQGHQLGLAKAPATDYYRYVLSMANQ